MSFSDIDKAMGTKRGVAHYRYHKAMEKLRSLMSEDEVKEMIAALESFNEKA